MELKKLLLIDANALVHRAWHALPPLTTKKGEMVNALYGFLLMLFKVIPDHRPDSIIAAFDRKEPTFRHEAYKEYKAQRVKQPNELYEQIPKIKEVLRSLGICVVEQKGFEADDIIGSIASHPGMNMPSKVLILTGDLDTLQLVSDRVHVLSVRKGVSDIVVYDPKTVYNRFGLEPKQMVDYKILRGDPSDNIPGVKGIGEQTAAMLLKQFHTLHGVLDAVRNDSPRITAAVKKKFLESNIDFNLTRKLVTVDCSMKLLDDLGTCRWGRADKEKVMELLRQYEFESLAKRVPKLINSSDSPAPPMKVGRAANNDAAVPAPINIVSPAQTTAALQNMLSTAEPIIASEGDWLAVRSDRESFVLRIAGLNGAALTASHRHRGWVGHNLKNDFEILMRLGFSRPNAAFDTMVASYLLNPGSRAHALSTLAFTELGVQLSDGSGSQQTLIRDAASLSTERILAIQRLRPILEKRLKQEHLFDLYERIELPLIPILARMEMEGVKIDQEHLTMLHAKVSRKLHSLEEDIVKLAGEHFNVNSPQQLKHILFDRLQLPTKGIGKTKTGISTAADELEKLRDAHPIIPLLLNYRELSKLQNTYIDALPQLVDKATLRIHAHFNQTVTATGRLSSSDPNLQNIPVRSDLGNEVRNAFVAERGRRLLSLDYNQIELRVAASMADDAKMIESFKKGEDIHARTAAEVFGVEIGAVTPEMRRTAKTVNFGVLYGLGSVGLARTTGSSIQEARAFIERYFTVYTGIAKFMEHSKEMARVQGYVETMFGRRRYIPEIHSAASQIKAQAERMAANMPLQGTAADIMKLAMIRIDEQLEEWCGAARMILQVHDELVFEAPAADVERFARNAKKTMETIVKLNVPIIAHAKAGTRWGSMEPLMI